MEAGTVAIESGFSGLYLAARVCGSSDARPPGLSEGLNSRVRAMCRPALSKPCSFLDRRSPAHGEGGYGSVSEGARCHAGVTWLRAPGTSHGPLGRSVCLLPGLPNAKAGRKASYGRRNQAATGCLCKQLLSHPALGLPGRNMRISAPRPGNQVGA